ncbi:MAG: hypothetical protein Q9203_007768 [Teloschistes exilis]
MPSIFKKLLRQLVGLCSPSPKTSPAAPESPPVVVIQQTEVPSYQPPTTAKVELSTRMGLPSAAIPSTASVRGPSPALSGYTDYLSSSVRRRMDRYLSPDVRSLNQEMNRILQLPRPDSTERQATFDRTTFYSQSRTLEPGPITMEFDVPLPTPKEQAARIEVLTEKKLTWYPDRKLPLR